MDPQRTSRLLRQPGPSLRGTSLCLTHSSGYVLGTGFAVTSQLEVPLVSLVVCCGHFLAGTVCHGKARVHGLLGFLHLCVESGSRGCKHGSTQRTCLIRTANLNGHIKHIAECLHYERGFQSNPTYTYYVVYSHALTPETFYNGPGTKGGSFYQCLEDVRGRSAECDSRDGTFEHLVGIGCAAAVHPVCGYKCAFFHGDLLCPGSQCRDDLFRKCLCQVFIR